jgi:hypothetical protein
MEIAGNETVMPPSPNFWETAVHEAGHVVVGLATGRKVLSVGVRGEEGLADFEPWVWRHPLLGGSVARVRRGLAVDVAGFVAEEMASFWEDEGLVPTDADRETWALLSAAGYRSRRVISDYFRLGTPNELLAGDIESAFRKAKALAEYSKVLAECSAALKEPPEECPVVPCPGNHEEMMAFLRANANPLVAAPEDVVAEAERAEGRAARVLRRRWADVLKLARSLCRRKSGRLTAGQVRRLLRAA